jgi:hypothetical protein
LEMICVVILLAAILIATALFATAHVRAGQLKQARQDYWKSLDELKADPHNPDLRQRVLLLGRCYSQMAGQGIFGEVQLANDISAAVASRHHGQARTE